MSKPYPILHVPTMAAKEVMLKIAHEYGCKWAALPEISIELMNRWDQEQRTEITHVVLVKSEILWIRRNRLAEYLSCGRYTLVNSLVHLKAYLSK